MKRTEAINIDGVLVLVEVSEITSDAVAPDTATELLGAKQVLSSAAETVADTFDQAMVSAQQVAKGAVRRLRELQGDVAPTSFSVEFGVKLTAKAGVITQLGGDAHLHIKLEYSGTNATGKLP